MYYLNLSAAQVAAAHNLTLGDIIIRDKGGILSKHYAVFVCYDDYGQPIVAENQAGFGTRYIYFSQFLSEGNFVRTIYFKGNPHDVKRRLNQLVGRRSYDLLAYNCEHFANEITTGEASSSQIRNAGMLIGGFILTGVVTLALKSLSK